MRWICLFILLWFALMMCISCSFKTGVQDEKVMWYFEEYIPKIRDNRPEGLTEHWLVNGVDHFVDIPGNLRKYKKGDTEFWPAQK